MAGAPGGYRPDVARYIASALQAYRELGPDKRQAIALGIAFLRLVCRCMPGSAAEPKRTVRVDGHGSGRVRHDGRTGFLDPRRNATRRAAEGSMNLTTSILALALSSGGAMANAADEDPYLWLEDVEGAKALGWVGSRNAESRKSLEADVSFKPLYERLLAIRNSDARIPHITKIGSRYYNFWKDADHVRGIWRRTTLDEYRKAEPAWETVLDIDALNRAEHANWVWRGAQCIEPEQDRCLVSLSRGGGDAVEVREFDLPSQSFVKGGFVMPEAKSEVGWKDRDTLYLGTDFGPGSLTDSGYPRTVREWKRGTPWKDARKIFEFRPADVVAYGFSDYAQGVRHDGVVRAPSFFRNETQLFRGGELVKVPKPDDAQIGFFRDYALITLRSAWKPGPRTFPAGALVAIRVDDLFAGKDEFELLFEPTARRSLAGYSATRNAVLLNILDNVRSRPEAMSLEGGNWKRTAVPVPANAEVNLVAEDPDLSDDYLMTVTGFLTPTSLSRAAVQGETHEVLKRQPAYFESEGLVVEQHEATSKDGTRVPYFVALPKDRARDGTIPTLLYGYGGFEVSQTPAYYASAGAGWLERGGAFVLANIRGGGEFGPAWHTSALKENRHKAYEDFAAVAKDLIDRKVTSPEHLGAFGGSNGGLLMGNMAMSYPELFEAVVCQVPLLDMKRYSHLLAGASWMGEYGDPDDPAQWEFIQTFSPYHLERADGDYPTVFFQTSTMDDRVHPGHARKMAAKMLDHHHDVLYWENTQGGHGGAANQIQRANMWAMAWTFFAEEL
ncbi:MAG: S9 family peptidase [Myxococcales bacterium]|nr:S9 family peptidase [Myxococcales bacterium]